MLLMFNTRFVECTRSYLLCMCLS